MPLLDHFHPPLSRCRHWQNLHSAWANALREHLNADLLPPDYFAEVQISLGDRLEIDVAAFEEGASGTDNGGVAVWAPPHPPFTAQLTFNHPDLFEVQILREEGGPRLVAAIELVSPANKDREGHRRAFAIKCASYLQASLGVAVIDVVTSRGGNLHGELLQILQIAGDTSGLAGADLYAAAYRTAPREAELGLEYWGEALTIGGPLPTLPLWIAPDLCLPLNLDATYQRACETSRIEG